jgi:hypothetical protein
VDPDPDSGNLVDPGSGFRDGKFGSGINIPNPQHWHKGIKYINTLINISNLSPKRKELAKFCIVITNA